VRTATVATAGACAVVAGVLLVTFWGLLTPPPGDGCNTSLRPSTFRDALGPIHLAGALVLSACLWALGTVRRESTTPGPLTLLVLAAVWVYIGVCWKENELFGFAGFVGVFLGPTIGLVGLVVLGVRTVAVERSPKHPEQRWRRHAATAQTLVWGCLLLGLPASMSFAWMRGADPFCF
jgi:hypothetical protein